MKKKEQTLVKKLEKLDPPKIPDPPVVQVKEKKNPKDKNKRPEKIKSKK